MNDFNDFFNPPPPPPPLPKKRTLSDVAEESGVSLPTVFRIRKNPFRTTVRRLANVAKVFGYRIAFINENDPSDIIPLESLVERGV